MNQTNNKCLKLNKKRLQKLQKLQKLKPKLNNIQIQTVHMSSRTQKQIQIMLKIS